jgi:hypothetical protein
MANADGFKAIKGGLNGEETKGEIKEGRTPGLNCTLDGGLKAKGVRERRGETVGGARLCEAGEGEGVLEVGGGPDMRVPAGSDRGREEESGLRGEKMGRDRLAGRQGKEKMKERGREVGRWKFGLSGLGEGLGRLRCLLGLKEKERLG